MKTGTVVSIRVDVAMSREALGEQAAADVCAVAHRLLEERESINMIFAAAPSQLEFLAYFRESGLDFSRINAFHMDEYIGLEEGAAQSFACFLNTHLFTRVPFRSVHCINGRAADPKQECERYSALLEEYPPDIVCLGIGENGHIAFNDPWAANFRDGRLVKIVLLDDVCRSQQVRDGCFEQVDQVPTHAITLTIPALLGARHHFCMVPAASKADAVHNALYGPINEACPASILRTCRNLRLYLDPESGSRITGPGNE